MKVVILAGGYGTRLSEETSIKPKPMVEIGGKPILWHIMKTYSSYGLNEFIVLLGYKGYVIKEYFMNYFLHQSDVTIDLKGNELEIHENYCEPWKVTLLDTGLNTMTGGRIKRAQNHIGNEAFMLTYGDGVADINIDELLTFHKKHGKMVTLSAVRPAARFGDLELHHGRVNKFQEKSQLHEGWINGGYFVLEPEIFNFIQGDEIMLEREPLDSVAQSGELMGYQHRGFWQCMDTKRDHDMLEELWSNGTAPWST
jgi:glucose-1-phosphate cytidylyltransferase